MPPTTNLLSGLAARLGNALAFADDTSEHQSRVVTSPSTRTAFNANARSFAIAGLREAPIDGHLLVERHTELNKLEMLHVESKVRYWLKSETAVSFAFEQAETLFNFPSSLHVLTFTIVDTFVDFKHAPISRMKNGKYKLEEALAFVGRFPLGGIVPPGGYPPDRGTGIFDDGPGDDFNDVFADENGSAGEEKV